MAHETAVVTGGGTGIGRSICHALADRGLAVIAVGRRKEHLEETRAHAPDRITALAADVSDPMGRDAVVKAVGDGKLRCLVHNAGTLEPVGPLERVRLSEWRASQAVNVEAPLFLTQALLPVLPGGRVLHISSGAAHDGYPGWGAYCVGKAGLHMLYRVLAQELADRGIGVGSMRPGVVDTPMQALIRQQTEADFPLVEQFRKLKQEGGLEEPAVIAAFTAWLLLETTAEDFIREEWNYNDSSHRSRWQR